MDMDNNKKQSEFLKRYDSFQKDCNKYRWLEGIKNNYEQMLKLIWREKENFRIYGIHFSARGDIEPFTVNPHRTIPWRYIYDGLEAALKSVIEEMHEIEKQYELKESEYKKEQESAKKESEDERIRKEIIAFLTHYHTGQGNSVAYDNARIAYLKKQKEPPTDAKLERVVKAARRVLNNWLDGTDCPDVSGDFAELEYAIREYDGEEKQKEQKPAEWSEEDELLRNACVAFIQDEKFKGYERAYECVDWLKSLFERFNLQPKQEWSEEDEKDIQKASDCLRDYANNYVQGGNSKLYLQSLADRIESLRP